MMSNSINFLDEMANFTFTSKYARYDEKKKRRETWLETVSRVEQMHLKKFKSLSKEDKDQISAAFDLVREKRVIPSMRSMQFGGKAIEAKHPRLYNCGVRHIDSIRSFAESFFILLCGTGVGFGLTDKFLNRLPDLVTEKDKTGTVITYVVLDTIEGWADSIEALLTCYFKNTAFSGRKIVFDYSKIRPKGAKIKTGGGKAPGYKGLKNCHGKVKKLLDCIIEEKGQTRLKTVDAYDILMHCADAVLSGGSRRSACSIIFDANDKDMMNSKTGNWFNDNPQRARSNNSAIIVRKGTSFESFSNLIEKTKEFGEPGFLYVENEDQLLNPCFSIDTKILTEDGWRSFDNLLSNKEVNILQDKRIKGVLVDNKEEWVLDLDADKGLISNIGTNIQKTGENKDVFELFLKCGRSVKATKDHLFATKRGMVQLGDLTKDDYVFVGVNDSYVADKESEDFKTAFLMGLWYGDGCSTDTGAIIDLWTSVENDPILARTENYIEYLINKNASILSFRTNVDKKPKFNKASGFIVGNVPKYRLCSSLLKQIFKLNGTDSKNGGDWLHSKNKDFKSGFLSGLFYCDGHTEYNRKAKTLSIRLGSINLDLLKNIQLILQELGSFSRINLNKAAGVGMLPDSNRVYKEYKTKTCYRLIIGGLVNCLNSVQFLELHNKDKSRIEMALSVSKKKTSGDYTSKVLGFEYVGKQDVYCLKEDNRRTLIAEGMVAKRCFEISFIPITKDGRCGYQFCVTGDTNLITKSGLVSIKDSIGSSVDIWNGKSWSSAVPVKTQSNVPVFRVAFSDGSFLDCTSNHKFLVKKNHQKNFIELTTEQLMSAPPSKNKYYLPRQNVVYSDSEGINSEFAYEYGFFKGDGHIARKDSSHPHPHICLYGDKAANLKLRCRPITSEMTNVYGTSYYEAKFDDLNVDLCLDLKKGLPTEIFSWDRSSILNFIAGWADSDGTNASKGIRIYGQEESIRKAQLLLTKVGINSSVNLMQEKGVKTNLCVRKNAVWYLQITKTIDIPCRRLICNNSEECKFKGRDQQINSIVKLDGLQDVYCLEEKELHQCVFNNVLTKQCNLSSVNGAKIKTFEELKKAVWAAALIGTLQTSYTDFPYLGHASEELTKEEALLGVSITGMMDNVDVLFNAENQREAAKVSVETNIEWSKKIGVNQAARVNCIKPEGTSSIVLSASSGIHPHHARRYFRRIQVNKEDNVYKFFKMYNDHACEESVWSANKVDDVITFPIEIDENAKIKSELSAIEHLQLIKKTQSNWVNTGTTSANTKPLNHSVSCTVIVKDDEWAEVTKYLFNNQEYFTAVSLLPHSGDKIYQQAPMEAVVTPEDEAKFNKLKELWTKIDYTKLIEEDDETTLAQEAACAGGKCLTTF